MPLHTMESSFLRNHLPFVIVMSCPILLTGHAFSDGQDIAVDVCDTEDFEATCNGNGNDVIMMSAAMYGRMELGRCVHLDIGYLGCYSDVLPQLDRRCSGRRSCKLRVPDRELERVVSTKSCLTELKTYLRIAYTCVQATSPSEAPNCLDHHQPTNLTSDHGYLSSLIALETGCGLGTSPWLISAEQGRRINLTLYDFTITPGHDGFYQLTDSSSNHNQGYEGLAVEVCSREYGFVSEPSEEKRERSSAGSATKPSSRQICGGTRRTSHVYTSETNILLITLTHEDELKTGLHNFLLEYRVFGCQDPQHLPDDSWFRRTGNGGAEVGCGDPTVGEVSWRLGCIGKQWIGTTGNCSQVSFRKENHKNDLKVEITYGAAISIVIGAAFFVGVIILSVGIIRYRREYGRGGLRPHEKSPDPRQDYEHVPLTSMRLDATHSPSLRASASPLRSAPFHDIRAMQYQQQLLQGGHVAQRIRVNGDEYEHIWETPLPGAPYYASGIGGSYVVADSGGAMAPQRHRELTSLKLAHYTPYRKESPVGNCSKEKPAYITVKNICTREGIGDDGERNCGGMWGKEAPGSEREQMYSLGDVSRYSSFDARKECSPNVATNSVMNNL